MNGHEKYYTELENRLNKCELRIRPTDSGTIVEKYVGVLHKWKSLTKIDWLAQWMKIRNNVVDIRLRDKNPTTLTKLALVFENESFIHEIKTNLENIKEHEIHINFPELSNLFSVAKKLDNIKLDDYSQEILATQRQLLSLAQVDLMSEMFIYFDTILKEIENKLRILEKQ